MPINQAESLDQNIPRVVLDRISPGDPILAENINQANIAINGMRKISIPKQRFPSAGGSSAPDIVAADIATTASIAHTGNPTIDGHAVVAGDLVLDKNNATPSLRGVWVVPTGGGAWTANNPQQPSIVFVLGGNALLSKGCFFYLSAANTYTGGGSFYL